MMLMNMKMVDVEEDLRLGNEQYRKAKQRLAKLVGWAAYLEVMAVVREEMAIHWRKGREKVDKSVNFIFEKHSRVREGEVADTWRLVKVSDKALGPSPAPPACIVGEQVGEVTNNITKVMQLSPKTAVFNKINLEQVELELEKAKVKARWHDRSDEERNAAQETLEEQQEKERAEKQVVIGNKINLNKIRVTTLPGNKEVILPDDRSEETEAGIAGFKEEMMEVVKRYRKEKCDEKGNIKEASINKEVESGIKELKDQIKTKKQIYGKTDKSDHPFLVTEEEYKEIAKPYVDKDTIVSKDEAKKMENVLNCHSYQICRAFGVCSAHNCSRRLKSALTNSNTNPPCLYFQIKDHKTPKPGEPKAARGLVGAGTGSFGREAGHIITIILDAIADTVARQQGTELRSTEDLLAGIAALNTRAGRTWRSWCSGPRTRWPCTAASSRPGLHRLHENCFKSVGWR